MKIQKRDGRVVPYEEDKIREAIHKANNEVEERYRASEGLIEEILEDVQQEGRQTQTVEHIQDMIEEHLVEHNKYTLAKKYIVYRYQRSLLRKSNTTDESILKLIRNENKELAEENSNKNTRLASTQRDYIAGEVSRDVTRRLLLPEHIAMAHDNGVLHFHDADYFIQPIFNCCLINIKDMLDNGTSINGKMIESPKSFQVACTVTTQIIAAVASNQYGGQSVNIKHLGKYLRKSREKFAKQLDQNLAGSPSGGGATVARCEEYYRRVVRQRRCGEIYGSGQPGCGVVQVGLQSRLVGCRRVRTEHAQDVPCRGCASLCRIGGRP